MNNLDKIYQENPTIEAFSDGYMKYMAELLTKISSQEIKKFCELVLHAKDNNKRVFFIGNGGSAATASHFIIDLSCGTRSFETQPIRAIALTDNNAVMTAIGNDFGYDDLFVKQLQCLLEEGDVLVAISASGNSQNIINAIDYAKKIGATTIGLSGFDGGQLKQMADYCVHVPTPAGEYGPVEDAHLIINHILVSYLLRYLKDQERSKKAA